ncbi:hypothetical protein D1872_227490 [compost metagenome]
MDHHAHLPGRLDQHRSHLLQRLGGKAADRPRDRQSGRDPAVSVKNRRSDRSRSRFALLVAGRISGASNLLQLGHVRLAVDRGRPVRAVQHGPQNRVLGVGDQHLAGGADEERQPGADLGHPADGLVALHRLDPQSVRAVPQVKADRLPEPVAQLFHLRQQQNRRVVIVGQMRGQLPDFQSEPVFVRRRITDDEASLLQRREQPVHRAFVQSDRSRNLA